MQGTQTDTRLAPTTRLFRNPRTGVAAHKVVLFFCRGKINGIEQKNYATEWY